jgi:polyhydroxyalkanoate synthesis repressor PhaR
MRGLSPLFANPEKPVIIKKHATRRLYNTTTHTCVTLDDLADLVRQGTDFTVHETKIGKDITRSVLLHILLERESQENQNLLPTAFLRQLIRFYGSNMQMLVPLFLDVSISSLIREQEKLRKQAVQSFGTALRVLEEVAHQNMKLFQQTVATLKPSASSEDARNSS